MDFFDVHRIVGGDCLNTPNELNITGIKSWEDAGPNDVAFIFGPMPSSNFKTLAGLVVSKHRLPLDCPQIIVSNPRLAMPKLLQHWVRKPDANNRHHVHDLANVHPNALLNEPVVVEAFVSIGEGAKIGKNTIIHSNVTIGKNCLVGDNCELFPHVTVYDNCSLGNNCRIHSNTVIGADGFGYEKDGDLWQKLPHLGSVSIGDYVEIGSNACIDRGCLSQTIIGNGVKVDNLVQIAHNTTVGDHTLIVAGALIGGSVKIGKNTIIAGNVAISDNICIGDGAVVMGQSGVTKHVPDHEIVSGYPAKNHRYQLRMQAFLQRLFKSK